MRIVKIGLPIFFSFIVTQSVSALGIKDNVTQFAHNFADSQISTSVIQSAGINQGADAQRKDNEAWHQYCEAKNAVNAGVRSVAYANAIQSINAAIAQGGEMPETYLLASRIYRGKGGVSYAKNYYAKASAIYLDDVLRYPESIESNLTAAIILYAGDVRYWDTYSDSKKKAEAYADIVLELFKNEKVKLFKNRRDKNSRDKNREKYLEEVAALAYLVKEDFAAAKKRFARAEKLYRKANKAEEKSVSNSYRNNNYGFAKIVVGGDTGFVNEEDSCLLYALYKIFIKQGQWYWHVSKQTEANKEFLLNCLTGFYL